MNSDILVIGDSCKDIFTYCDSTRLCPDIPVPVLNVIDKKENPGMAMNVFRNIKRYINCDILTNDNWEDITKNRFVHLESNHLFVRVDTPHDIQRIDLSKINFTDYKIIVVSDYNKGFLTNDDIKSICDSHDLVFLDTKKILGVWSKKAKFIKINNFEYQNSIQFIDSELSSKIIRTKGSEGAFYQQVNYPVNKVEVKDTSGAGDSFFAALIIKYYQSNNIIDSIKYANECASKVVSQKGVTTI